MRPLTDRRPKPLLPVGDRSLLERVFDTVAGVVDEFVVVVGYRGDAIRDAIGESYRVIQSTTSNRRRRWGPLTPSRRSSPSSTTTSSCSTATWSWMHRFPAPLPTPRGQQSRPRRSSILGHTVCSRRPRTVHSPDRRSPTTRRRISRTSAVTRLRRGLRVSIDRTPSERGEYGSRRRRAPPRRRPSDRRGALRGDVARRRSPLGASGSQRTGAREAGRIRRPIAGTVEEGVHLHGPVVIEEGALVRSGAYIEGPR